MNFGIETILNHLTLSPVEMAHAVEEQGFDSLFLGEHINIPVSRETPYVGLADKTPPRPDENPDELRKRRPDLRANFWYLYDPLVALTAAAAVTERIELGIFCLIPQRDPITLAQEIATLDQISNGRVIFVFGSGWNSEEMANHGVNFKDRFKVTRERVQAMKALWTEDEAEFHGDTVDFDPVWSYPKPVQEGGPPILLGQNGRGTFDRIVSYCDGWQPDGMASRGPNIGDRIAELRSKWEEGGRNPAALHITMAAPGISEDPVETAAAVAKIEQFRTFGVDRMLFNLGSPKRDLGYRTLDRYAEFLKRVS